MCCGKNRLAQKASPFGSSSPRAAPTVQPPKPAATVSFMNVGNIEIKVIGPVSGVEYHFDRPGARIEVDPRDRILLGSIRQLRQV